MTADRPATEPRRTHRNEAGVEFVDVSCPVCKFTHAHTVEAEAAQGAAPLPFDDRPCTTECCDAQRARHIHEGTHEDHTRDGKWCIDCDVVIGRPGENVSREGAAPEPHRDYAGRTCTTGLLHSHEGAAPRAKGLDVEWWIDLGEDIDIIWKWMPADRKPAVESVARSVFERIASQLRLSRPSDERVPEPVMFGHNEQNLAYNAAVTRNASDDERVPEEGADG